MMLSPKSKIDFSQIYNLYDASHGGYCFAYTSLFLSYVSIFHLKQEKVDYSAFKKALSCYENKERQTINRMQNLYPTRVDLLNSEIAMLNQNADLCRDGTIKEIDWLINHERQHFHDPVFYFLSIYDEKSRPILRHSIGIYLASPYELHVFDSNSGLYIFDLPQNINADDIGETLKDIVFNKNIFSKLFFNPNSKHLTFDLCQSVFTGELNDDQQCIYDDLKQFINNPQLALEPMPLKNIDSTDVQIRNFLRRHIMMVKQQYLEQLKSTANETTSSFVKSLQGFWHHQAKDEQAIEMKEMKVAYSPTQNHKV